MVKDFICIADHFLQKTPMPENLVFGEYDFQLKMGGTTYEVTTHFNREGRQNVLEQFRNLILSEHLI